MAELNDVSWDPDSDPRRQIKEVVGPVTPTDKFMADKADIERITKEVQKLTAALKDVKVSAQGATGAFQFMDGKWPERRPSEVPEFERHILSGRRVRTHTLKNCTGRNCVIHNPSKHRMVAWPRNLRDDTGRIERVCPHGVGHPDPDDVAYWVTKGQDARTLWTHGCDGCCAGKVAVPEV